eukprot:3351980-Amphidinium_carterae.1
MMCSETAIDYARHLESGILCDLSSAVVWEGFNDMDRAHPYLPTTISELLDSTRCTYLTKKRIYLTASRG